MKRACIFCGKTNLTKEHVLPKWIQNYFGAQTGGLHVVNKQDGSSYQFTEKAFNRTAKIVCENCNSGWMSKLEGDIQALLGPMMIGRDLPVSLSTYQQSMIAIWVAKTLTVLEYSSNEPLTHIPKSLPEALYNTGYVPQEHTIYIGYRTNIYGEDGTHAAGFLVQSPKNMQIKPEYRAEIENAMKKDRKRFTASLVVGHVYFYMIGTDIENAYGFVYPYIPEYLMQLWPDERTGGKVWPSTRPIEQKGSWEGINTLLNERLAVDFYNQQS